MRFPKFLHNFNVTFGISDFSGICEEVTLPKLKFKTEEWRGAGMSAPLEIEVGLEKLECTFKFGEQTFEGYLGAGLNFAGIMTANITGYMKGQDGTSDGMDCIVRGWVKTVDPGTWKAGDIKSSTQTVEMAVQSWLMTRGMVPLLTIDIVNGVQLIGPSDQHAAARQQLKLG
ncbi:MAG TPA: phage major tail tube protein [Oligoflexus sp.]|uniref:phage major tail tube protein n=1 Tax=Oligoflexus sp. TaxID=1971216 RepID=UPI002D5F8DB5|nr:phage major tail tube protein [Oligoflexus sp.]HYX36012.1 phage major tail tube protein [Oligoflexus sp.]